MNIDSGGQCHSDKTVNVEEFCLTALLLAQEQCGFAVLEDQENFIRLTVPLLMISQQKSSTVTL